MPNAAARIQLLEAVGDVLDLRPRARHAAIVTTAETEPDVRSALEGIIGLVDPRTVGRIIAAT